MLAGHAMLALKAPQAAELLSAPMDAGAQLCQCTPAAPAADFTDPYAGKPYPSGLRHSGRAWWKQCRRRLWLSAAWSTRCRCHCKAVRRTPASCSCSQRSRSNSRPTSRIPVLAGLPRAVLPSAGRCCLLPPARCNLVPAPAGCPQAGPARRPFQRRAAPPATAHTGAAGLPVLGAQP